MLLRLASNPTGKVNEADLRHFEKALLQELGYGLVLGHDSEGRAILAEAHYTYRMEEGPVLLPHAEAAAQVVSGKTLIDLASNDFTDTRSRIESKQLMRTLMAYYLSGTELETRKIFKELQEL
jgi:DNA repair protein RecO (recombination protein O)